MDPKQISSLAKLLRDSGDKVLNCNFKLTLSGQLLRALNDSFSLIADQNEICAPQSFQVVKPNNSKSDVFRDLQFIHDFVQKTRTLCVTQFHNDEPFDGEIDISKFRNLQRLEVHRVEIGQIRGIQQMRAHLQEIACVRSIESVKDIISHCGGDKSNGFIWTDLRSADFTYNQLSTIDCSLEFTPWLQQLNLSHNRIVSVDAIKWLPNLKFLDLSFNRLPHIPMFNAEATRRLKVLVLTNNYIEELSGISRLDALNELDLSGNCLLDHSTLLPLSTLIALQYLNLLGNPLACHPKHRQATSRYLHKNTSSIKFVLDSEALNKTEKSLTGSFQSYHSILTSRVSMNRRSNSQSISSRCTLENTPSSSVGSVRSIRLDDTTANSTNESDEMSASTSTVQKKLRARRAVIVDDLEDNVADKLPPNARITNLEGNKEHLETKKQMEQMRKDYGDGWLLAKNGSQLDGQPKSPSTLEDLTDTLFNECMTPPHTSIMDAQTSTPNIEQINAHRTNADSDTSTYVSAQDDSATERDQSTTYNSVLEQNDKLKDIYGHSEVTDVPSDPENNEVTYIVCSEPDGEELFLIVSDVSIKEKDSSSGRTKTKWTLKTLESCERTNSDVLRLNFDTIKKDKKERTYKVEKGLCQKLEQYLRNILSKRPLSEMNQTLYRCANCAMQFSREKNHKKQITETVCPECKSSYVIEIKEAQRAQSLERPIAPAHVVPLVVAPEVLVDCVNKNPIENCESHSSIAPLSSTAWRSTFNTKPLSKGSATSLNESSSCSKISKSGSSFDSNQSVAGSSNGDRDADFNINNRNGESDVEILSNPSQSSIEVLGYSSRKHSEDRRVSQQPSLDTIDDDFNRLQLLASLAQQQTSDLSNSMTTGNHDDEKKTILTNVHLTESSSSGSVTDSICTAYEQHQHDGNAMSTGSHSVSSTITAGSNVSAIEAVTKTHTSPEKQLTKTDSVISNMFGGLFQSTNLLMSRRSDTSIGQNGTPCNEYKFSYTNFDIVDHRLKLFLYQNLFEDDNEHLKWLVKGRLLMDSTTNGNFNGIFVMSTTKFYVLQLTGAECDDVAKFVKRQMSGTIDRVETVRVLPWKIGVTFSIKGIGDLHLFLQDILRTDSLLLFFANNPLPNFCTLEYQISERLSQKLLKTTENAQLKMLAILNTCEVSTDTDDAENRQLLVGLIVTETYLYLIAPSHRWIVGDKVDEDGVECYQRQQMSNLIEVEKKNECLLRINFLDEIQDKIEIWECAFETESSAASTLNAISQSWEMLFGVDLAVAIRGEKSKFIAKPNY